MSNTFGPGVLTEEKIQAAIDKVFEAHGGYNIPLMHFYALVCGELKSNDIFEASVVQDYIFRQVQKGTYRLVKGRNGGICKPTVSFPTYGAKDVAINPTVAAVNNHTCPCCGNDKVSTSERTCWKCGGNLHV
jgi:hypothetical protein